MLLIVLVTCLWNTSVHSFNTHSSSLFFSVFVYLSCNGTPSNPFSSLTERLAMNVPVGSKLHEQYRMQQEVKKKATRQSMLSISARKMMAIWQACMS